MAMLLCAACSSSVHSARLPENAGGTSISSSPVPTTTAGSAPVAGTTSPASPVTSMPASPSGWCASGNVAAKAGPAYTVYGNGEAVDVTVSLNGQTPCRLPSMVTVVLADKSGTAISSAQSDPRSVASLTLAAGRQARLRIDWVSQGCFSPGQVAAGGKLEWATPQGSRSSVIQGLGQDSVAPCHSAFGVSDLQPGA